MKNGGWKSSDFIGVPEFSGKTLGVVGYGNIGKCAAKIGRGFGMNIIAHDPYCKDTADDTELVAMDALLDQSDFITLHVLLTPESKGLMSRAEFKRMKNTAVIANACRGPEVDEKAIAPAPVDIDVSDPAMRHTPDRFPDKISAHQRRYRRYAT
jgi:phosphoglycerate dehydrogenase-like enzyme